MKVKCINNSGEAMHFLVLGEVYTVDEQLTASCAENYHHGEFPDYRLEGKPYSWRKDRFEVLPDEHKEPPVRNKYNREIVPNVFVDVYDVLRAFSVTDPCLQHLIKKALAVGQRGHKTATQDYKDILDSAERAYEIHLVWKDRPLE